MYGDKIVLSTYDARLIALNRDSGEVVWEVQAAAPTDPATGTPSKTQAFSAPPVAIKTAAGRELVIQGESTGGSLGTRSWIGAFDIGTGALAWRTFTIPAPGEPGSETWKDTHNAWRLRMCCQEQGRASAHGALWALDVRSGKIVAKAQHPILNESGMLGTDGGLVFTGHHTGRLVACDADTLKELWSFSLGTPITAPPMTYSVGGKRFIAVVAGDAEGMRGAVLYQPSARVAVFGLQ
jgi:outer membrane protein assembly factor BamB